MARCRHNPNLPQRRGLRPLMRRDLEHGLAYAEISAPAISCVDRQAAYHRRSLRARVALHQLIRERLRVIGVDPALQRVSGAAMGRRLNWPRSRIHPSWNALTKRSSAPKAATPTAGRTASREEIARMAEPYHSGRDRVDFADASPVELLAFCVASEIEDRN
jgi:hypothetical protein